MLRFSRALGLCFLSWVVIVFAAEAHVLRGSIFRQLPSLDFFVRWEKPDALERAPLMKRLGAVSAWSSQLVPGLERWVLPAHVDLDTTLTLVQNTPSVIYAEKNQRYYRYLPILADLPGYSVGPSKEETDGKAQISGYRPDDPYYPSQWALSGRYGINPSEAWDITRGSKDVKVAVIDTGADTTHPDLQGQFAPGYDFLSRTDRIRDTHGHGTHVSGIIGAISDNRRGIAGISPEVTLIPIRAVPDDGDETDQDVISAFEFASSHGARLANCSFGKRASSRAVGEVIQATGVKGLLAIVAAGNDFEDLNRYAKYPAKFRTDNMLVVAASDQNEKLADFSNVGLGWVQIAAPGQNILSTVTRGAYANLDGTSMATPMVTGVAALAIAAFPEITVSQLRDLLTRNSRPVGSYRPYLDPPAGRLDASAAVKAAKEMSLRFRPVRH